MVIQMGLHSGINATYEYSMVQHSKFIDNCSVSFWHGGYDNAAYTAQGHRTIQSGTYIR